MNKFIVVLAYLLLTSPKLFAEDNPLKYLQSVAKIQTDQKSISLEIQNHFHWDIFCPALQVKATIRDPENYLDIGEARIVLTNIYIRKEQEKGSYRQFNLGESQLKKFTSEVPTAVYSSVTLEQDTSHCLYSTLEAYIWHAARSSAEEKTLIAILKDLDNPRPADLQQRIAQIRKLELSNIGLSSLKGLEFFTSLEKLDISDNPITDLSPLQTLGKLSNLDISNTKVTTLKPVYRLRDQLRLRAAGTPLKNPEELRSFRN